MKKSDDDGWGKGLSVWVAVLFTIMVLSTPVFATDCGVSLSTDVHDLTGYFGDNSAAPYDADDTYDVITDSKDRMWQATGSTHADTWSAACSYCEGLEYAGEDDWRLPTIDELESIIDSGPTPAVVDPLFSVQEGMYWSLNVPTNFDSTAWVLNFFGDTKGQTTVLDKTTAAGVYTRCVRDVPTTNNNALTVTIQVKVLNNNLADAITAAEYTGGTELKSADPQAADPFTNINTLDLIEKAPSGATTNNAIVFGVTKVKRGGTDLADIKPNATLDYFWSFEPNLEKGKHWAEVSNTTNSFAAFLWDEDIAAGATSLTPEEPDTYTVTVKVWDHEQPTRGYGSATVTFTLCKGDCKDNFELCEYEKSAVFINENVSLILKSIYYQANDSSVKINLGLDDVTLKLVDDPTGDRILFALEMEEFPVDDDNDNDGFVASEDCNDNDPNVYPGAIDPPDGIDQDCFPTPFD